MCVIDVLLCVGVGSMVLLSELQNISIVLAVLLDLEWSVRGKYFLVLRFAAVRPVRAGLLIPSQFFV